MRFPALFNATQRNATQHAILHVTFITCDFLFFIPNPAIKELFWIFPPSCLSKWANPAPAGVILSHILSLNSYASCLNFYSHPASSQTWVEPTHFGGCCDLSEWIHLVLSRGNHCMWTRCSYLNWVNVFADVRSGSSVMKKKKKIKVLVSLNLF